MFVSSLPRALATAALLLPDCRDDFVVSNKYAEFELRIAAISRLRLRLKTWFALSRLLWMLGLNRTQNSYAAEKNRAVAAAKDLLAAHKTHTPILMAHGLINHHIARYLKRCGFATSEKRQTGSFTIHCLTADVGTTETDG